MLKSLIRAIGLTVAMLSAAGAVTSAHAETRYVTDEFEITMRRGPSTQNAIVRMLPSGTPLEVLEADPDTGYTHVRLQSGNAEGYVLTRYLQDEQDARTRLAALQARFDALRNQSGNLGVELDDLRQANQAADQRIATLERDNARLTEELDAITRTAANVLNIDRENTTLREELTDTQIQLQAVQEENRELSSRRIMNWFLIGGGVMLTGIIFGLIVPRIRWRKRSGWGGNDLF
jgi:SH3 domain protein